MNKSFWKDMPEIGDVVQLRSDPDRIGIIKTESGQVANSLNDSPWGVYHPKLYRIINKPESFWQELLPWLLFFTILGGFCYLVCGWLW